MISLFKKRLEYLCFIGESPVYKSGVIFARNVGWKSFLYSKIEVPPSKSKYIINDQ